jgi:sodium transport system ATP-binding protein
MIQVQKLNKRFDQRLAVRELSFEASDGTITGLLGSNGAGKTTTLRMICGVLSPDSGVISIDGREEADRDIQARQRRLGALLDHTGMYARLTVRENLMYFGKLHGLAPQALNAQIERVTPVLGLRSIADRRSSELSQGERTKAALARAVLHSPQNLLLDEPTNALDVPTVRSLREFLKQLRDAGTCIVFSSHVLDEVRMLCDKLVIISHGTVVAQGSPAGICEQMDAASLEDAFMKLTPQAESCTC